MINSLIMHENDTVVTLMDKASRGDDISYIVNGQTFKVKSSEDVPKYHKVAIKTIKKGDYVIKYGERIGYAILHINPGDHVHTHNLTSKEVDK